MIVNKDKKIEKVISSDPTRAVINNLWYDVERKRLIATNGRSLAIIGADVEDGDKSGFITPEALKEARKQKYNNSLATNGALVVASTGTQYARPTEGTYPNVDAVLPKAGRKEIVIGIDPRLLLNLVEALGGKDMAFIGIPLNDDGSHDVLRPYSIAVSNKITVDVGVLMPKKVY